MVHLTKHYILESGKYRKEIFSWPFHAQQQMQRSFKTRLFLGNSTACFKAPGEKGATLASISFLPQPLQTLCLALKPKPWEALQEEQGVQLLPTLTAPWDPRELGHPRGSDLISGSVPVKLPRGFKQNAARIYLVSSPYDVWNHPGLAVNNSWQPPPSFQENGSSH